MRIAVISAILEGPEAVQSKFNEVLAGFKGIVKGRMGLPFPENNLSVISITVVAEPDVINSLTGKLGKIEHVIVKTAISKNELA